MNFPERLKMLRENYGLSKAEFARLLEIPYTTYNNYESGTGEPRIELLKKIAKTLDISMDTLTDFQKPNNMIFDFKELLKANNISFGGEPLGEEAKRILLETLPVIVKISNDAKCNNWDLNLDIKIGIQNNVKQSIN